MTAILIADQDDSIRTVLADVTRENFPNASVYLARTADEALEQGGALRPPCAAVLHWSLARERIDECVGRLKAASAKILLISAWDVSPVMYQIDVDGLLQKPFDLTDYLASLRLVLDKAAR